jgi:hypothetical protein
MRSLHLAGAVAGAFLLASCSSAEWVNPRKSKDNYGQDYNRCEMRLQQEERVQAGSKALLQREIDRCMAKEGWLLVETP